MEGEARTKRIEMHDANCSVVRFRSVMMPWTLAAERFCLQKR